MQIMETSAQEKIISFNPNSKNRMAKYSILWKER